MRQRQRLILATVAAIAAAGCATSPVSPSTAKLVPDSRVHNKAMTTPAPGTASVTVTRDTGLMGAACATELHVSGSRVADLRAGEKIVVYLPPGKHVFGARAGSVCGGGADQMQLELREGEQARARIAAGQAGDIKIEPSAF